MEVFAIVGVEEFNGGIHHLRPRGDEWLAENIDGAEEDAAAWIVCRGMTMPDPSQTEIV